jgi:hypothetical protein
MMESSSALLALSISDLETPGLCDKEASLSLGKIGSAQELVTDLILGCFPDGDEFRPGDGHTLSLEEQVAKVLVPSAASQQGLDVAVDRFHHEGLQTLPSKLVDPALQIPQHRTLVALFPQSAQALFEQVGFHHSSVQSKELVDHLQSGESQPRTRQL